MLTLQRTGLFSAVAGGLLTVAAHPAHAFVIDGDEVVGDGFTVSFLLSPGETDNGNNLLQGTVDLTASVTYEISAIDFLAGTLSLDIDVTNTTDGSDERILSFGFDTNPGISVTAFTGGSVFDGYAEDTNFPSFQTIEFCAFPEGCSGGSFQSGLQPGHSDFFSVSLVWAGGPLTIAPSVIKFQGDLGSFEFEGCEYDCEPPNEQVPEPTSLSLLGLGLIGLSIVRRRRIRLAQS